MTVLGTEGELLKMDALGRVRTSRVRREAILDEFERSGGSGAQFAALLGIKYPTFASWIQSRRRQRRLAQGEALVEGNAAPQASPVWLEAVLEKESAPGTRASSVRVSESSLTMQWPGGAQVELNDQRQVPLMACLLRELASGKSSSC